MKTKVFLVSLLILFCTVVVAQVHTADLVKEDVKEVMRKVADWQIENQSKVRHQPLGTWKWLGARRIM